MQDTATDDDLMERAARGERAAFDAIVLRHAAAMMRLARATSTDDASAADAVQEAFLHAYQSAATYRPGVSSARTWLLAITRNVVRRTRRGAREVPVEDVDQPLAQLGVDAGWGTDAPTVAAEERDRIARAIASLAPEEREVIILRDLEGLPGDETARLLGLALPGMKSRLHRARLRLMAALRGSEGILMEKARAVGGLRCSDVLERLSDYVDDELAADERARVAEHLRHCSVCVQFGGRFAGALHAARASLGVAPAVDDAQRERILRALREE